jgi:hypothetical protein
MIRDHLISHVLSAIADWSDDDYVTFFGGTASCRTWLPEEEPWTGMVECWFSGAPR